nr:retrovirus-related Pol polyprotein from transposon TNT 1-94 [Tanacetum cinerariifolium]
MDDAYLQTRLLIAQKEEQALTSDTQTDKALVYDSDGSAEVHHYNNCYNNDIFNVFTQEEQYTELLDPITEPHAVQQNNNNVISVDSSVEHGGGTIEPHLATIEETVDSTTKTRRPHPRSNTKNYRVTSVSKSSCIKNKDVEVEEQHMNLLLSKNKKHMSPECNSIKVAIRNDKYEVVCVVCYPNFFMVCRLGLLQAYDQESKTAHHFVWNFIGTVRFGNDHVDVILGYGDLQRGNILIARVYYVEALGHNLFLVGQFCDLDLEAKVIATACYTQNRSIIHRRFNKTPYELINGRKPYISFLHVFGALCYPMNDREDIGKLGTRYLSITTTEAVTDNVLNAIFDENTFVNHFAPPSTSSAESSSQYVDPSNMHTFYNRTNMTISRPRMILQNK